MQEGRRSCTFPTGKTSAIQNLLQVKKKTKKTRDNNPLNKIFQPTEKQETTAEVTGA